MPNVKHLAAEYGTQALLILAGVTLILSMNRFSQNNIHPLEQKEAPSFTLDSIKGTPVNLAEKLGKQVIVLDFFATWCPPCVEGLPIINKLADEYTPKGVQFYAVNSMEDPEVVKPFLAAQKITMEVLMDLSHSASEKYGVNGIPQTVIINKNGMIHTVHVGISSNFEKELRADLESALRSN